jgi:hypothetical protein
MPHLVGGKDVGCPTALQGNRPLGQVQDWTLQRCAGGVCVTYLRVGMPIPPWRSFYESKGESEVKVKITESGTSAMPLVASEAGSLIRGWRGASSPAEWVIVVGSVSLPPDVDSISEILFKSVGRDPPRTYFFHKISVGRIPGAKGQNPRKDFQHASATVALKHPSGLALWVDFMGSRDDFPQSSTLE